MGEEILRLENVTKVYKARDKEITAVRNVDLDVGRGEIFSLLGPNGAGKTTTVRMIITLEAPTSGTISVSGYDVKEDSAKVRDRVGLVPQGKTLYDRLTADETLRMMADLYSIPEDDIDSRIDKLLDMVNLEDRRDGLVETFSGGMKQRLSLASGLVHRPGLLLLDEPTTGLDPQTRRRLWKLIRELNEEGMTIFINTHNMEEAEVLSNRVGIMNNGRLVEADSPVDLKRLVKGGEEIKVDLPKENLKLASDILAGRDDVNAVRQEDGGIIVTTKDRRRALSSIPQMLSEEGVPVSGIEALEPSLEDVFIELTGD